MGAPIEASFLDAGVDRVLGALVEPGEDRILDRLAGDEIHHHAWRLVAHFKGPLADERRHQTFLGDRHLFADRIGGAMTNSFLAILSAIGLNRSR